MDIIGTKSGPRLVGIGEATVVAVRASANDPSHQVKINHPDFGTTTFIPYVASAGMYRVPRVGDVCYVFCNENFHQYPVAWGHRISPELAKQLIGGRQDNITVIYSSGATNNSVTHKIELDDGQQNGIRITTESGHSVNMSNQGSISVTHKDGTKLDMTSDTVSIQAGGSTLTIGPDGIQIKAAGGSTLDVGATILGKAADTMSKFDEVTVSKHKHTGNLGYPTTAPIKGT